VDGTHPRTRGHATPASTFARGAARLLAGQERHRYRRGEADVARAEALVVAACGLVREPARAVAELCWILPDPAAAEVGLAELLAERIAAQARADAWYDQLDAATARPRSAAPCTRSPATTACHSFATDMLRAGADIVLVSELLGHASLNSTRIYALSTAADRARAVELLRTDH